MVSIGNTLNRTRRVLVFTLRIGLLLTIVALSGTTNAQAVAKPQIKLTPTSPAPLRLGSEVITPGNADRIRPLSGIGRGFPLNFDWSPDGKMFSVDTELGIWQYQFDHLNTEPTLIPLFAGMSQPIASSPDRKLFFVVVKGQLELLDSQADNLLNFEPRLFYQPFAIAFMPDGHSFALKSRDAIGIWDISTLTPYVKLDDTSGADLAQETLTFSPDGKRLYEYGIDYQRDVSGGLPPSVVTVLGWDLTTMQQVMKQRVQLPQQILPRSLVFDPVHTTVAVSVEGSVLVWRLPANHLPLPVSATPPPDATIEVLYGTALAMAFSPDGTMLAAGGAGGPAIWNMDSGTMIERLATSDNTNVGSEPVKLEFSPDGKTLAYTNIDGSVQLWDVNTRQNIATLDGYSNFDHQVAMSPDGRLLTIVAATEDTVRLWDLPSGKLLHTFPGNWGVAFSPDGKELAIYDGVKGLRIWDTSDYLLRTTYNAQTPNCAEGFNMAFSPDWKILVAGIGGSAIALCDVAHGTQIDTIPIPERFLEMLPEPIERVIFSPDGKMLVYNESSAIIFVDLASHHVFDIPGIQGMYICFSPDGRTLAYFIGQEIQLLDLSTNKVRMSFDFQYDNQASPTIQFSPDGRLLLAFEEPDTKLWNTTTGKLVSSFPNNSVKTAMFSPDGKTLLISTYGSIQFWGIPDWPYF